MNLALVGATGIAGEHILELLSKRSFPLGELRLFASAVSDGEFIEYGDDSLLVGTLSEESFVGIDLVIFAAPEEVSRDWLPAASKAGAVCLDLSAYSCLDGNCSMLVAGVNDERLVGARIAAPASLTVHLSRLLDSLTKAVTLRTVLATAVASASDKGRKGLAELQKQSGELLNGRPATSQIFPAQLAFNCLPSAEEGLRVSTDLCRVLDATDLDIQVNFLRLPLFYGDGAFLRIELAEPISFTTFSDILKTAPGIAVQSVPECLTPIDAIGEQDILVQLSEPENETSSVFDLWFVADNLSCGAVENAVRLAERLASKLG